MVAARRVCLVALFLGLWACSDEPAGDDTATDAGAEDTRLRPDRGETGDDDAPTDVPDGAGDDTADTAIDGTDAGSDADTTTDAADCESGEVLCQHTTQALVCNDDGEFEAVDCAEDSVCVEPEGCLPLICEPNEGLECIDDDHTRICDTTGTHELDVDCTGGRLCDDGDPATCAARECGPAEGRCQEDGTPQTCDEDGLWQDAELCVADELGTECFQGLCLTQCQIARRTQSYVGCEYWAADLGNFFVDAEDRNLDFAIVVTNANDTLTAEVTLSTEDGALDTQDILPGAIATFAVPEGRSRHNTGTGLRQTGYRLESTVPVAAYQFNPLETVTFVGETRTNAAASTDASLLLPDQVLDDRHIVLAWEETPAPGGTYTGGSLLAIMANSEATEVTIDATALSDTGNGVIEPVTPGTLATFELDPFDVLQLTTDDPGADWTGTIIESSAPILVFSGNECARVPAGTNYCDHLEEGLFGLTAWGTEYVATKSRARGEEADWYRIVAAEAAEVTLGPPEAQTRDLEAGEVWDVSSQDDFVISADAPILVGQVFEGSGRVSPGCDAEFDCSEVGDPSLILLPPTGQFRNDYIFLTPDTYQQDFANVVLSTLDQDVTLDDDPLGGAVLIGDGPYAVVRTALSDGPHRLTSDAPFGLVVYGYGGNDNDIFDDGAANVSYGYPGGLNFLPLNPKDPLPPVDE